MSAVENARVLAAEARHAGFHRVGFAPVDAWSRHELYRRWLAAGHAGEMGYLVEQSDERADPRRLLAAARTVMTVALAYGAGDPIPVDNLVRGRIARYARGADYHTVMKRRLHALADAAMQQLGRPFAYRACVDTAPLLEREAASAGGLGFVAKNTMVIAPGLGSYTLLGELLTDLDVEPSRPSLPKCGSCRACLDACPTQAFVDAYTLDARRCISYLTIESHGPIPVELREGIGDRIFGCDVCQEVCPFNAGDGARAADEELRAKDLRHAVPSLGEMMQLGANQFRKFVDGTSMRRVRREQLLRNVAVALGNVGGPESVDALARALDEKHALVRMHAAWALGRIARRHADVSDKIRALLQCKNAVEEDADVRAEIAAAL